MLKSLITVKQLNFSPQMQFSVILVRFRGIKLILSQKAIYMQFRLENREISTLDMELS